MHSKNQTGFTLIELAMVMIIMAAILGSIIIPLNTQLNASRLENTDNSLAIIKEALLNYAANTGSLPCPAASDTSTGYPDKTTCDQEGVIPWAELGTPRHDAWGQLFRYRALNQNVSTLLELTISNDASSGVTQIDNAAVAIIFSVGKNGDADGDSSADNADASNPYRQSPVVYAEGGDAFDDRLVWISNVHIAVRLAQLGKKWEGYGLQPTPL